MAKKKGNYTLVIALVVIVLALVAFLWIKNRNKPKGEKVNVEKVELRTIREQVAASGKVFPQTEVKISSDVSGEIVELSVEEGDSVVTGQLLAKIDPDAYQSQVERGRAQVNSSKAQLANARSQVENLQAQKEQIMAQLNEAEKRHKRNIQLKDQGVISDADFETSQSNLEALQANMRSAEASIKAAEESVSASSFSVQSAEATLSELQTSLRRTTIYAPMDGIISRLNVEAGERVVGTIQMAGTEMMRVANLNAMEVRVEVSETDIPRVTIGDTVSIEVDAYLDRQFMGHVTMIANTALGESTTSSASLTSDQVTNFEVRINIDPRSYQDLITPMKPYPFRPGMSASVEINTTTHTGVASVPIQSVTTRERKDLPELPKLEGKENELVEVVFRVMDNDTLDLVPVVTGIQDDTNIEVLEGLEAGQEIVAGPYVAIARRLKQGDTVQRAKEEELLQASNE